MLFLKILFPLNEYFYIMKTILQNQRSLFQIPEDVSYLNGASMSPLLEKVAQAGIAGMESKRRPDLLRSTDYFEDAKRVKKSFADLIGCPDSQRIAILPSVSYGIATVVKNVQVSKGQKILLVDEIFPSNYYGWERLAREKEAHLQMIKPPSGPNRGPNWNQEILAAIDKNTAVISLGHIHWADGTLFDLQAIRAKTKAVGAAMIIDGSQTIGAMPIDVESLQPDALMGVTYKWLFGPYSNALAYFGPYFDEGIPIEESWINRKNSEDFSKLVNYQTEYQPGAGRYSMGQQSNFINLPMILASIAQVKEWGVENIQTYARELTRDPIQRLQDMGLQVEAEENRSSHLIGIRFSPTDFDLAVLKEQFQQKKVFLSFRGNAVRVSTHLYTLARDWDKVVVAFGASRR